MTLKLICFLSIYRRVILAFLCVVLILSIWLEPLFQLFVVTITTFVFYIPRDLGAISLLNKLSMLLNSGHPVAVSFEQIKTSETLYQKNILRLLNSLRNGTETANAFKLWFKGFPAVIVRVIEEGSKQGRLPHFLKIYLHYHEMEDSIRRSIHKSLYYPSFVFIICSIISIAFVWLIIPFFSDMYIGVEISTPFQVKIIPILLKTVFVLILCGFLLWLLHILLKQITKRGLFNYFQNRLDTYILSLFFKGMIKQGDSPGKALLASAGITACTKYIQAADSISKDEDNGIDFKDALMKTNGLPPDLIATLASAAVSKNMDDALNNSLISFKEQHVIRIRYFSNKLGLVAILFNIILWGFFVISFYMPIFRLSVIN